MTVNRILFRLAMLFTLIMTLSPMVACSKEEDSPKGDQSYRATRGSTEVDVVVNKLRDFCGACHAIGNLKFITSDNNQFVWNYLYTNDAPNSRKKWADQIHKVLSWPDNTAPAADQLMVPPNQDWMPKGIKRTKLADDKTDDKPTREVILRAIEEGM